MHGKDRRKPKDASVSVGSMEQETAKWDQVILVYESANNARRAIRYSGNLTGWFGSLVVDRWRLFSTRKRYSS